MVAYSHISDAIKKKLDDKAEKYNFFGYSHETKGYKVFNPDIEKVIISRDVTINEQGVWNWSKKVSDSTPKNPPMPFYLDEGNFSNQPVDQSRQHTGNPLSSKMQSNIMQSSNRPQLKRRMLTRLEDYVIGNDNEMFDEDIVNFVLFADCDPITF